MASHSKRHDKAAARAAVAPGETVAGEDLPTTRPELLARHAEARRRRDASPLGGPAYREATAEIGRIEVAIARVERAMNPPLV